MNIGLPFLEQIRKAGHRLADRLAKKPNDRDQTGAESGLKASGLEEDTGWGWVALTFSQVVAAVTVGYHTEHNTNDSHKTIHATGLIYERERTVAIGDWIDIPVFAGNYTGAGAMSWTVTAAQQRTFGYFRLGETLYLSYWIEASTLGGSASASLKLTLPQSLRIAQYASTPCHIVNGPATTGRASAIPGDTFITLLKTDSSNFSTGAALTVQGQIAIKVSDIVTGDTSITVVDPVLTYTGGSVNFASSTVLALTSAATYTMSVNREMTLQLKAAAGGGGGVTTEPASVGGGGGGGGGETTTGITLNLVPSKTYTLVVGAAGVGGTVGGGATAGTNTTFVNTTDATTLMTLNAGAGGGAVNVYDYGAGGTGGTGANRVTGGNGGFGSANPVVSGAVGSNAASGAGGGGGGGGSTGGNGGNGSATGGTGGAANTAGGNNGGLAGGGGAAAPSGAGGGGGGGGAQFTGSTLAFGGGGGGAGKPVTAGFRAGGNGLAGGAVFTFISAP